MLRFVALVLAMAIPGAALAIGAIEYGDDVVSGILPAVGDTTAAGASDGDVIQSAAVPRDCSLNPPNTVESISSSEPGTVLIELSRALYPCADRVIVAGTDPAARRTAARVAMGEDAPLLLAGTESDAGLLEEVNRLAPNEVTVVGGPPGVVATLAGDWDLNELPVDPGAEAPGGPGGGASLWVLDAADPDLAELVTPAAVQSGADVIEVGGPDAPAALDSFDVDATVIERLRAATDIGLIGSFTETQRWRLETLQSGAELPGGGLTVGPDRRYIAFYGAPGTSLLGVLGEQDPAATLARMEPLLADYRTDDGVTVVPTFELIATVAASEAGDDGDYSNESTVAALRPYVDYAADNGVYVLLDLQPGRTDFGTQARLYEELLVEPHVGLALDPEWRLAPDQVHLRQFGSVDAAEVNEVSAWLAGLVRDHALPQKMFLIHQFKQSMVTNRSAVEERPELSMVIQMDGQGPLGTKYGTLAAMVRGGENAHWQWGWKNFYDEDTPMATPAQTLAVDPQPVYVSYQ